VASGESGISLSRTEGGDAGASRQGPALRIKTASARCPVRAAHLDRALELVAALVVGAIGRARR
jgi:hypothetical protein